ncbi:MAG: ATP-dependent DNA ligase [Betaproteobacteria bacterium]
MEAFARLFAALDATTSTHGKLAALDRYFRTASADDAAWAAYFLAGGKPRQPVPTKVLREVAVAAAGFPQWLFDECYDAVGDFAETVAHVLPPPARVSTAGLAEWMFARVLPLRGLPADELAARIRGYFDELDAAGRFLLLKLLGGGFRVGVSRLLVTRALAAIAGVDAKVVAQRLMGYTAGDAAPGRDAFLALIAAEVADRSASLGPYPFFLAHPLTAPVATLGECADWMVEWKWDGIRAQLVRRGGATALWSRGEELITDRFPEIAAAALLLDDGTVLDGEIVVMRDGGVAPFAALQTRVGRRTLTAKVLGESPAVLLAYDMLEADGEDLRGLPQHARRSRLEALLRSIDEPRLPLSRRVALPSWDAYGALHGESRSRGVEGFMLKHRDARYGVGRSKEGGTWWKWKIDPMRVDAVLVYAQRGHGRRASLYSDYTFAVWDARDGERRLTPFAKAYSGLTDAEMRRVDAIVRRTTIEKFGPVRSVTPTLVFELGFEGIQRSARHKSGIAVRFPRILRWRDDKRIADADSLDALQALLTS